MSKPSKTTSFAPRKTPRLFQFALEYFEQRIVCLRAVELLLPSHRNKWLRPEVESKLACLDLTIPLHAELDRLVRLSLALLEAVDAGTYRKPRNWAELDPWLRRALAYFVKSEDAIPDHHEDGFEDDHREFRQLEKRLAGTLIHFEAWYEHRKRQEDATCHGRVESGTPSTSGRRQPPRP
ncbi:MAG: hypothetical protein IPM17_14030 [Verrucomicrobia bacterium]|jgi:hypothetical protein|nr:hypothetical protein [Verrucomicrobiota bacterium]